MMYFRGYGDLEYLEPKTYYAEPWTYVGSAYGDDGVLYDLVRNAQMEMKYTNI